MAKGTDLIHEYRKEILNTLIDSGLNEQEAIYEFFDMVNRVRKGE